MTEQSVEQPGSGDPHPRLFNAGDHAFRSRASDFVSLENENGLTRDKLSSHLSKLEDACCVRVEKGFRGDDSQTLVGRTPTGRRTFENYRDRKKTIYGRLIGVLLVLAKH